jgi:hypothetical protein
MANNDTPSLPFGHPEHFSQSPPTEPDLLAAFEQDWDTILQRNAPEQHVATATRPDLTSDNNFPRMQDSGSQGLYSANASCWLHQFAGGSIDPTMLTVATPELGPSNGQAQGHFPPVHHPSYESQWQIPPDLDHPPTNGFQASNTQPAPFGIFGTGDGLNYHNNSFGTAANPLVPHHGLPPLPLPESVAQDTRSGLAKSLATVASARRNLQSNKYTAEAPVPAGTPASDPADWPDDFDPNREIRRNDLLLYPHTIRPARNQMWPSGKAKIPGVPEVIVKGNVPERLFGMRHLRYDLLGARTIDLNVVGQRLIGTRDTTKSTKMGGKRTDEELKMRNFSNSVARARRDFRLGLTARQFKSPNDKTASGVFETVKKTYRNLFIDDNGQQSIDIAAARLFHNITWTPDHATMTFHPPPGVSVALASKDLRIPSHGYPLEPPTRIPANHPARDIWSRMFPHLPFPDFDAYMVAHPQYIGYNSRNHPHWNPDRDPLPGDADWLPVPRYLMPAHGFADSLPFNRKTSPTASNTVIASTAPTTGNIGGSSTAPAAALMGQTMPSTAATGEKRDRTAMGDNSEEAESSTTKKSRVVEPPASSQLGASNFEAVDTTEGIFALLEVALNEHCPSNPHPAVPVASTGATGGVEQSSKNFFVSNPSHGQNESANPYIEAEANGYSDD